MTKRKPNADSKAVPKKRKYAPQSAIVMPGMGGILISCDRGASNKTVNEAMDLFQRQYLNNDKDNGNGEDPTFTAEQNDIEAELQAELANLRNPKRKDQIFRRLDFGSDMMAFLQTDDSDPLKLVLELFDNLAASGSGRSFRYLQRLTPVQQTCYANMNDIQSTIQGLVETHLPAVLRRMRNGDDIVGDEETSFSFSVLYRHRNNDQLNREELVRAVSVKLWQAYPKCTVDLKQPEVVVLLEVCKSICCCSIVSDYFRLKKFNLNAVFPATSDPTN